MILQHLLKLNRSISWINSSRANDIIKCYFTSYGLFCPEHSSLGTKSTWLDNLLCRMKHAMGTLTSTCCLRRNHARTVFLVSRTVCSVGIQSAIGIFSLSVPFSIDWINLDLLENVYVGFVALLDSWSIFVLFFALFCLFCFLSEERQPPNPETAQVTPIFFASAILLQNSQ